jgi:glycine/serine hydroxymethyltransferase
MVKIVDLIDEVLANIDDENVLEDVSKKVNALMAPYKLFAY